MNEEGQDCGDCGHDHDDMAIEVANASQFILGMRAQNVELLKIAAQVAGFAGNHPPLKPNDMRQAMKGIWEVYSELYNWVDPEEAEGGDDDEDADE